jgi:hypothetical protein
VKIGKGWFLLALVAALALGAGIAVAVIAIADLHLGSSSQRKAEPFSPVAEPLAGELAERFRPWLMFDSREKWRPLNVDYMFDEGRQRFCVRQARTSKCLAIHDAAQFDSLVAGKQAGSSTYVDIDGNTTNSYHGPASCRPQLDCNGGPRSAIYYRTTESNGRYYIDYWWFLRFNHFARTASSCLAPFAREVGACDEHEGDWEGVTVATRTDDDTAIEYVVYAAHKGTFRYGETQLHLHDGTRPVVYLAEGSHAAYPLPCSHSCHQPSGLAIDGLELPESDYDGRASWGRNAEACTPNAPGSCLLSLEKQPWTGWPGEWGAGCTAACHGIIDANSPRSPGVQARFQTPWCSSQNGVFTCDGRPQRCGDWLGPQVMALACDPALLVEAQGAGNKPKSTGLGLVVGGVAIHGKTTPGVVQSLGAPLEPGGGLTAIADGPQTEVIVRAAQGKLVAADRFAKLERQSGQSIPVVVAAGQDGPTVTAAGHAPIERTISERPTPAGLSHALRGLAANQ